MSKEDDMEKSLTLVKIGYAIGALGGEFNDFEGFENLPNEDLTGLLELINNATAGIKDLKTKISNTNCKTDNTSKETLQ